jgi:CBS domain-containing protein
MSTAKQILTDKDTKGVITVSADLSVQEACRLMRSYRIGCLVVTGADQTIEGIFTERDVVNRLVAEDRDASETKVGDIMTREVIVVEPERPIAEVEAIMKQHRIRHLPVAGERELLGLVSIGDVMAHEAATSKQMVHYLTEYLYGRH